MVRWKPPKPRSDAERRMRRGFENWIDVYWCASQAWYSKAEYETMMYSTELAQYKQGCPMPTLKDHMIQTKGEPR